MLLLLGIVSYDKNDFCDKTDDKEKGRINKCNEIMSEPFLIKNAADGWGWNLDIFKYENLLSTHSDVRVDYYPHGIYYHYHYHCHCQYYYYNSYHYYQ